MCPQGCGIGSVSHEAGGLRDDQATKRSGPPLTGAAPSQPTSVRHVLAWQLRDFAMSRHEQYGLAVQSVAHRNLNRHARLS
jgi:hypothetical protein